MLFKQLGCPVNLSGQGQKPAAYNLDSFRGFLPVLLLDRLSDIRNGFDSISGIKAGGIELVLEPWSPGQSFGCGENTLTSV